MVIHRDSRISQQKQPVMISNVQLRGSHIIQQVIGKPVMVLPHTITQPVVQTHQVIPHPLVNTVPVLIDQAQQINHNQQSAPPLMINNQLPPSLVEKK